MVWIYKLRRKSQNIYLAYHQYYIPKNAVAIRKVDGRTITDTRNVNGRHLVTGMSKASSDMDSADWMEEGFSEDYSDISQSKSDLDESGAYDETKILPFKNGWKLFSR